MMKRTKIGINGFGRIGRIAFRIASERDDLEVVAINDLLEVEHLAYLLKYDSVHGKFNGDIRVSEGNLVVNGKRIRISSYKNPEHLKWNEVGVELVLECTGIFTQKEGAEKHLKAGAKKVVVSAPSKDLPMYVMGVNHQEITPDQTLISNASCTTNCLAPVAKIMHDNFGITEALMTTVHATTASQTTVDSPSKKNYRLGRSALANIVPSTTGAAIAVTKVLPELKGKLTGMAFRVPVADVSVVDLTVRTHQKTSYEAIKNVFKEAAEKEYKGIVSYTEEPVVSQDFVSNPYVCTFDAEAGIGLNEHFFKLIAWYDNEYGYSTSLVELARYFANL